MENISNYVWFQEGPGVRKGQYNTEGVKLLNVSNLVEGKIDLSTSSRYISEEEANGRYKHFLADEGDLIIASSGIKVEYFDKKMGFIQKEHLPICMNTSTIRFKALNENKIDMKYFMYFLKSNLFKIQLNKLITGSAQLNFGPSHLKKVKIHLPSINNQTSLIKILDIVQDIIDLRKKQIEDLDKVIKSKLKEILESIDANKEKCSIKLLQDITDVRSSKRVYISEIVEKGIPFYRGTEIVKLSNEKNVQPKMFIKEEHYEKLKNATSVPKIGDLLLPSICSEGEIWKVNKKEKFYFKDGRVLWIRLIDERVNSTYLHQFLKDKITKDYNTISSGTTFSELKIISLKKIKVTLPPLEIQNQFASFVEKLEEQKEICEKSLKEMKELMDSLMNKYFG